jgi:hypothetical protein
MKKSNFSNLTNYRFKQKKLTPILKNKDAEETVNIFQIIEERSE